MMNNKKIPLTSSEIAQLWAQYMSDNMAIYVFKYFLNTVEDKETKNI